MTQEYILFTFDTTHAAITAEKLLAELGSILMPTLREISASCGMALRLTPERRELAELRMVEADIGGWHVYHVLSKSGKQTCTLLGE